MLANQVGAIHNEPINDMPKRNRPYTVRFLLCHVAGDKEACDYIYGKGPDSLCNNGEIRYARCETKSGRNETTGRTTLLDSFRSLSWRSLMTT